MGGGSYDYISTRSRSMAYSHQSKEEVFSQREMNPEMDIKGKKRECRESEEHPNAFPIIIALDVTGSMGIVPQRLITGGFPEIMKRIMDNGVKDPQVCFLGIGDHYCDEAPLQVGQFESSDELLEKWLKMIYLEGHGGGNNGESYGLAHFFAANCVEADAFKHGRKGVLITIGDEPCHLHYSKKAIENLFGISLEADVLVSDVIKQCKESWNIYHINLNDWSGQNRRVKDCWVNLLGSCITTEGSNGEDIPDIISGIILNGYSTPTVGTEESKTHLR